MEKSGTAGPGQMDQQANKIKDHQITFSNTDIFVFNKTDKKGYVFLLTFIIQNLFYNV